jgi:hypothetical protein
MQTVSLLKSAVNTQSSQGVTTETKSETTEASSGFDALLQSLLDTDKDKSVSEEELFSAMIVERITALKGEEAGTEFKDLLQKTQDSMKGANGYIPYEDAARTALKKYQEDGKLTAEEADQIHSEAFGAAQLDSNLNALYDGIGGANDPTKAVAEVTAAIASAKAIIDKYASGAETPVSRALETAIVNGRSLPNPYDSGSPATSAASYTGISTVPSGTVTPKGTNMDGADGFLFKPVSSNSGKLAILTPGSISQDVTNVYLKDSTGKVIEEGKHWAAGFGAEGGANPRKKFTFNMPGASYPKNLIVQVVLNNGSTIEYNIPDPSQRYD